MPFSQELTVNDIIRKLNERKKYVRDNTGDLFKLQEAAIILCELEELLGYIENDEEY